MSDVVLRIDADTARYIAKIAAASEQTKQLGHHTKGIGDQWAHANEHLGRTLIRGAALSEVFSKLTEEANKFAKTTADISKASGGDALARSNAANQLGVGKIPGIDAFINNASGAATSKERTSGLEQLASYNETSRFKVTPKTVTRYIALVSSGLYKPDELINLLKQGKPLPNDEEQARRLADLTPEAREEIEARTEEHALEIRKEEAAQDAGGRNRRFAAKREAAELEHPGGYAIVNSLESLPGVGEVAKYAEREQGDNGVIHDVVKAIQDAGVKAQPPQQLNLTAHDPDRR